MTEILSAVIGLIVATGFVLALAYVCLRVLRRLQPGRGAADGFDFVRSVAVGPRERVTLVRYRGELFMLGVAAGSVRLLARFPDEAQEPARLEAVHGGDREPGAAA